MDFLANFFTIKQFSFYYFHLSSLKLNLNYSTKKYMLGWYYGLIILNLYYNLFFMKIMLNLLTILEYQNGKILLFSELDEFLTVSRFNLFFFLKIFFYFQKWIPGRLIFQSKKKRGLIGKNFFLFIPNFIIVGPYLSYYSGKNIYNEAKKLLIPVVNLIDSSQNLFLFDYFVFSNLKSLRSGFFYLKLLEDFFIKIFFKKKLLFCTRILHNF